MQIKGVSSETVDSSLQSLKKLDGLMAEDGGSAASAPGHSRPTSTPTAWPPA